MPRSFPFTHFSFYVLPACCVLCGQRSRRPRDLCAGCERELPFLENACVRCAMPLPAAQTAQSCGKCLQQPPPHDACRAPFRYTYPLDKLIQRFKFNGDQAAGRVLGDLFAARINPAGRLPDCLLPVPLHRLRLRERGFNQSASLAEAVAGRLGLAVRELACRTRETAVQSGMDAVARRRNVRGAFSLGTGELPAYVAIVDDVVTTGSTTAEIARLLRSAGVARIEVWALARAV